MNEMFVPNTWKNDERLDVQLLSPLWAQDNYLRLVCEQLDQSRIQEWERKPNTHFLVGAMCESCLWIGMGDAFSHPNLEVRVIPTFKNNKVRSIELTVVDNVSDQLHIYATLTPTIDGWDWKDMIPNPLFQMMMR